MNKCQFVGISIWILFVPKLSDSASYINFTRCEMKLIGRGMSSFFMIGQLYQIPVENVDISVAVYKKSNGYRPFLFNQTFDYCYYMRNPKAYLLVYTLHKVFISSSNVNHTCPYDHDIIIDNFVYIKSDLMELPIPNGDYMFKIEIITYKIWRGHISIYITKDS
ncbi:uncharacterized protein Dana_GF26488 [Drosophila ananassae]|uniref:MD-2-related lipid-recognition domain-containing protein n=1 Tax=Drosophila ananassae TaxID=7217 RepID=A0A0P8XT44_DROAN|nr:uncharacterized protein LOC26513897 [Drosophila ananassae]KPU77898.1 uncharacterized protein Dana_GF26488 [Drosophila ananassae]